MAGQARPKTARGAARKDPVKPRAIGLTVNVPEPEELEEEESADQQEPEEEKILLFSLDGRDYYIPREVGGGVAVGYMWDLRTHGAEYAQAGILEYLLGEEGFAALAANRRRITDQNLQDIMMAVNRHVLGPLEAKVGKAPGPGTLKSGGS